MFRITSILILITFSSVSLASTITIRSDEWFPMNGEPNAVPAGFMIDFANEIFSAAGHTVDYKLMPWERAVEQVRKGKFDCVVGAYTEDAPDFIYPDEPWGMDVSSFYIQNNNSWSFSGIDSLNGKKIGVIRGYSYGDEIDALIESKPKMFKLASGNDALEKNLKKLNSGRLDIVIESQAVGAAKIKIMGLEDTIRSGGEDGAPTPLYIACSPNKSSSAEYINLVNEGTKTLRDSGRLQEIMQQYGLSDWK